MTLDPVFSRRALLTAFGLTAGAGVAGGLLGSGHDPIAHIAPKDGVEDRTDRGRRLRSGLRRRSVAQQHALGEVTDDAAGERGRGA